MSEISNIEWTDSTWNPLLGCSKCSAGCKFCYAIRTAWRLQHNPNPKIAAHYAGLVEKRPDGSLNWTGKINLLPDVLVVPLSWKTPRRIFVNSQSDLFHDDVPESFIDQVFAVMAACPQHTFQVLTKRAERMKEQLLRLSKGIAPLETAARAMGRSFKFNHAGKEYPLLPWPIRNVWLGVSVEDQRAADERIPHLLATPAAVRFLSCEPLLSAVEFSDVTRRADAVSMLGRKALTGIHWVIAGGESGPGARAMHPDWARSLRDQCAAAAVAFHFKQHGEWVSNADADPVHWNAMSERAFDSLESVNMGGHTVHRVGKKAAGRLLDGREHNEFPVPPATT